MVPVSQREALVEAAVLLPVSQREAVAAPEVAVLPVSQREVPAEAAVVPALQQQTAEVALSTELTVSLRARFEPVSNYWVQQAPSLGATVFVLTAAV